MERQELLRADAKLARRQRQEGRTAEVPDDNPIGTAKLYRGEDPAIDGGHFPGAEWPSRTLHPGAAPALGTERPVPEREGVYHLPLLQPGRAPLHRERPPGDPANPLASGLTDRLPHPGAPLGQLDPGLRRGLAAPCVASWCPTVAGQRGHQAAGQLWIQ